MMVLVFFKLDNLNDSLSMQIDFPNLKLKCFAYGPPPVVTQSIAEAYEPFIYTYVNGEDLVPRLSWNSVRDIIKKVEESYDQSGTSVQTTLKHSMSELIEENPAQTKQQINSNVTQSPSVQHNPLESDIPLVSDCLVLAGTILHIRPSKRGKLSAGFGHMKHFGSIYLSLDMLTHHLPNRYEEAFEQLLPEKPTDSVVITKSHFLIFSRWKWILLGTIVIGVGYFTYVRYFSSSSNNDQSSSSDNSNTDSSSKNRRLSNIFSKLSQKIRSHFKSD